MNFVNINDGAAARAAAKNTALTYLTATVIQKSKYLEEIQRYDFSTYLNRLAEFYCYPIDTFMELYNQMFIFQAVAYFPKTYEIIKNTDAALFHCLDIIKNNYSWFSKSFTGAIQEDIDRLIGVPESFDGYMRLWNKLTPQQQNQINSFYKVYIKG